MLSGEVSYYRNLAELANTNNGKINFFDQNQKAFFLDAESDEWFEMMIAYAKNENLQEEKIAELEDLKWSEMPSSLKLFAFDYCIVNGSSYQE